MDYNTTFDALGNVDIYVIDQILKGRYLNGQSILDAGCGKGRNLKWFYKNDFEIFGIDADSEFLANAKQNYPKAASNFRVGTLDKLPYGEKSFDHILCCAVLHFAQSETHFTAMFSELIRVLKPDGMLLIRMASNIGLDGNALKIIFKDNGKKGNYYLTRERITDLITEFNIDLIEPIKTTNVKDERAMTTLVFQKMF
ncbi:methylase involved in ubiquinone/menaquinone biosynthesis [Galbibacter orientalis DSM 19592]|uniref:Methylase involved in ubiquinone/menaquinone biosynthesis n=1 Tax=Galbibacter orientalis DSM 19592 TaxID=926559 RepID=I3C1Y2_9FLAO|nr:class I SAM-dependent methyltransferase [Galbibacter orientalis]EIJ37625.1 methylase involved in ubiquinone/menaquinone biosynthesis [Galbibacter orientalis DSM 19592]